MPTLVTGGLSFAQVSAGGLHTCGVTTGNAAYCWGQNSFGQLGPTAPPTTASHQHGWSTEPAHPVRRTPHMDLSNEGALAPDEQLTVRVFADTGPARPGEASTEIVIEVSGTTSE